MVTAFDRRLILALGLPFPSAHIILGIANLHRVSSIWPSIVAMAICAALMILVTLPSDSNGLPRHRSLVMIGGTVAMEILVQSVLPFGSHPGYAAWQCGAIQMLMVTVAIRNRIRLAWLGITLFATIDFTASMIRGLSIVDALALIAPPVMWIVLATAVNVVLRRCEIQIREHNAQEQEAADRIASEHARNVAQNEWVNDLDRATRPLLEKIVAGQLSDADREDCKLLESQLRDQIRGRALASASVLQAARAARSRGVRVDIFDDRGSELPPAIAAEAHAQLAAALVQAERGSSVKGRALPADADIAVTILSFNDAAPDDEIYVEIRAPQQAEILTP